MKRLSPVANAGLILSLVIALYVGFRAPNLWSVNYYIPSVFDGFWRRSLLGTLLYPFGALRFDYHFVAAVQALVLLALVALLMAHALRSGLRVKLLVMLFLIGPAGGYLFHEVGYVEQLLYLMLLAALAFSDKRQSLVPMAVALFVHEMAAFTVIPLYLAALVVGERWRTALLHGVLLLAVFAVIYLFFQTADPAHIERLMQAIKAHVGYTPRADYYDVFRHKLTGPRPQNYFAVTDWYRLATVIAIALLTAAAFVRKSAFSAACVLVACLAPLAMGFLGWDTSRFTFLSLSASFFVLIMFKDAASIVVSVAVSVLLLAFALFGYLVYFDDYQPRPLLPYPRLVWFLTNDLPAEIRKTPQQ
jgi:hypothetical protein